MYTLLRDETGTHSLKEAASQLKPTSACLAARSQCWPATKHTSGSSDVQWGEPVLAASSSYGKPTLLITLKGLKGLISGL